MNGSDPTGTDWNDREIDLIVADYFEMLRMERIGAPYVKAERNRALQELTHRSRGSIEFKHQNISAVLHEQLGMDWIPGYKPLPNYQNALIAGIERYLDHRHDVLVVPEPTRIQGAAEDPPLFFESPPIVDTTPINSAVLTRLIRKFDPAARDAQNRTLGKRGEGRVFFSEQARLKTEASRGPCAQGAVGLRGNRGWRGLRHPVVFPAKACPGRASHDGGVIAGPARQRRDPAIHEAEAATATVRTCVVAAPCGPPGQARR